MKRFKFSVAVLLIMALVLAGCSSSPKTNRYEAEFLVLFDTVTTFIGYAETKEEFEEQANLLYDEMEIFHQLYNIYNDFEGVANIKTINENAGIAPVKVDRRVIDLLLFSKEAYELTGGKVNVAFGAVLSIWHDYRTNGMNDPFTAAIPSLEELQAAALHTSIDKVIIDEAASTVYLEDPLMSLDVGSIAKGFAVERITQKMIDMGYVDGLLSVGGNVRATGRKGEERSLWKVGIQNPDGENGEDNLFTASLTDMSLVTSGDYQRYYTVNGVEYHHIIDPLTLFPAAHFSAVTILNEDSGLADALSTAVFNMTYEEGAALIESMENTEALWVFKDGSMKESSGFEKLIGIR